MFWIKIPEIKKKKNSWDPHCRSKWAGITSQKVRGHRLSHYKKKIPEIHLSSPVLMVLKKSALWWWQWWYSGHCPFLWWSESLFQCQCQGNAHYWLAPNDSFWTWRTILMTYLHPWASRSELWQLHFAGIRCLQKYWLFHGKENLINKKILLYSTGNYIQYPVINHIGKEHEKECVCIYMYICTTKSLCWFD